MTHPLMGGLRQFSLPNVLRAIESGQRTGRLRLRYGGLEGAIYFSGGRLLMVERAGMNFTLAQQFLRARLITAEQLMGATELPLEQAEMLPDVQMVRALVGARQLTQEQLRAWAMDDAVTLLQTAFVWPDGDFLFEDGVLIPAGRVALPLAVGPLIEQAQRRVRDNAMHTPAPLAPEMVVDFAEVEPDGDAVRVTREQWRLLTAVDGKKSLIDISQQLGEQELTTVRLAGQLAAAGVVVVVSRSS